MPNETLNNQIIDSNTNPKDIIVDSLLYRKFDFFMRLYKYMQSLSITLKGVLDQINRKVAPFSASERRFLQETDLEILLLCLDKIDNYFKKHQHG